MKQLVAAFLLMGTCAGLTSSTPAPEDFTTVEPCNIAVLSGPAGTEHKGTFSGFRVTSPPEGSVCGALFKTGCPDSLLWAITRKSGSGMASISFWPQVFEDGDVFLLYWQADNADSASVIGRIAQNEKGWFVGESSAGFPERIEVPQARPPLPKDEDRLIPPGEE